MQPMYGSDKARNLGNIYAQKLQFLLCLSPFRDEPLRFRCCICLEFFPVPFCQKVSRVSSKVLSVSLSVNSVLHKMDKSACPSLFHSVTSLPNRPALLIFNTFKSLSFCMLSIYLQLLSVRGSFSGNLLNHNSNGNKSDILIERIRVYLLGNN